MKKSSLFILVLAVFLFFSSSVLAATALPQIPIEFGDSSLSDWMGQVLVASNPDPGHGSNITKLWAANDAQNLYLLVERDPAMLWSSSVVLDLDQNRVTGFKVGSIGIEAGISLPGFPGQVAFVGNAKDGSYSSSEFPGAVQWATFDRWIECSVPLYVLRAIEPGTTGFTVSISAWSDATGSYQFTNSAPVPIPAAVWLLGSGLVGLVALNRRKK